MLVLVSVLGQLELEQEQQPGLQQQQGLALVLGKQHMLQRVQRGQREPVTITLLSG